MNRKKIVPTEDSEQIAYIQWIKSKKDICELTHHSPNGGYRNVREAVKFKKMGTNPGFPDIFIAYPCGMYHGLLIEFKKSNATPSSISQHQKRWLNNLILLGYKAEVAYGCDDAIGITMDYLSNNSILP